MNILKLVASRHAWNTGNGYTKHGQRIGAVVMDDGSVVFSDIDRGIGGFIPKDFMPDAPPEERVIRGYMHTGCEYWSASMLTWDSFKTLQNEASRLAITARSLARPE